jgi:hypothetical protein
MDYHFGREAPVVAEISAMAREHRWRRLRDAGVVGSGLQQQHTPRRVLAQTGCQFGASRAGADDDVVEFHHLSVRP